MDIDKLPYIAARLQRYNPKREIKWVVVHSTESSETGVGAENTARYFASSAAKGSAHINVDNNSCVRSVWDDSQAAAAPGSNTEGVHIELVGTAHQSAKQWMDDYSVDAMDNGANCAAQLLTKHKLPNRFVGVAQVLRGEKGWTTHHVISQAFKRSTHWDPGPNFPISHFQSRINHHLGDEDHEGEFDLSDAQYQDLKGQLVGANMMLGFLMQKISKVDFETFERENGWLFDEFLTKDKPKDGGPSRYELFLDGFNNAARLEENEDLQRFTIDLLYNIGTQLNLDLPEMPKSLQASDTTPLKD